MMVQKKKGGDQMAEISEVRRELALDCFLLAGKVMMESGAETYRVEDTMIRMAVSQI